MRLRKVCVSILVMLMLISSLQVVAFAEEGTESTETTTKVPNFVVMVMPENTDCTELESLNDVNAKLVLTKEADPTIMVELPMTYDKDLGGFMAYSYVEGDAMQTILADLAANQAQYGDLLNLGDLNMDNLDDVNVDEGVELPSANRLAKKLSETLDEATDEEMDIFQGYKVELQGLPEGDHYTYEHTGLVLTSELIVEVFDFAKELLAEFLEIPGVKDAQTVQEILDAVAKYAEYESFDKMLADLEMTEADISELNAMVALVEDVLAQAKAGTFEGILVDSGYLTCACPVLEYFEIYHEYYKEVNGKRNLVARIAENSDEWGMSMVKGAVGDYVQAEDWIKCEYDGLTYDFVNSYDSWVLYDDEPNWEDDIVTEFKLGDFEYSGLVLRYVHVEDSETPVDTSTDDADKDAQGGEDAPLTGDHTPIGLYIALLATAIVAVIVLFVYKKRNKKDE